MHWYKQNKELKSDFGFGMYLNLPIEVNLVWKYGDTILIG